MNYLIGDIGNSNIKICKINKKFKIVKTILLSSQSNNLEKNIRKALNNFNVNNTHKKVLFSSVVPKVYRKIKKILIIKKFKVYEIKNFNLKKLMKFKVKKFYQLGSDRIANSIGAYYKYKSNCIVVDFGTATTFDVVKKPGIYDGGVISPGINLSIKNLFSSTALLPMFRLTSYPINYGKNTLEALTSGFFWGYEGLINNIIKKIIKKNGKNFKIILTGGYGKLFKKKISNNPIIQDDITIKGIFKIYRRFLNE
tara:strand:+ start:191 stop:952 length:762 start_codon:yes stop_codon:yes gene_type:complete